MSGPSLGRAGGAFWNDYRLTVRDRLRRLPDVARVCAALEQELAARYPTERLRYSEAETKSAPDTPASARDDRGDGASQS